LPGLCNLSWAFNLGGWKKILSIATNNNFPTKLVTNLKTQNPRENNKRKE